MSKSIGPRHGKAIVTKLYNIGRDIYGLPRLGASPVWGVGQDRFGTGTCSWSPVCMSLDEIGVEGVEDKPKRIFNVKVSVGLQAAIGAGIKGLLSVGGKVNATGFEYNFGDGSFQKTVEASISLDLPRVTLVQAGVKASVPAMDGRDLLSNVETFGDIFVPTEDLHLNLSVAFIWGGDIDLNLSELGRHIAESVRSANIDGYP